MNTYPRFYVGQRVAAVETHARSIYTKGQEYIVKRISPPLCKCGCYQIDIGVVTSSRILQCDTCLTIISPKGIWWADENEFAPIHEDFQAITYTKILEQELSSVN